MRIVYAYADRPGEGACSDWLCSFPARALSKVGHDVSLIHVSEFVDTQPRADIIVVERLLWNGADPVIFDDMPDGPTKSGLLYFANLRVTDAIVSCQGQGAKVIAVFDDHFEAYPDSHPRFGGRWLRGLYEGVYMGYIPIEHFKECLSVVDAAMVPSAFLAEHYGKYARRMYRIHNRPDLALYPTVQNDNAPRRFVVGWAGTSQHEASWRDSNIITALSVFKDAIVLSGHFPAGIRKMLDEANISYMHNDWVDYDMFPMIVASYDIGICPLAGEFDKGRSWIKWLECSLMGKPVVAQDYAGVYSECQGGLLAKTEDDWVEGISAFMDGNNYRTASNKGLAWAWQQGWDSNLSEITDIFEEVLRD